MADRISCQGLLYFRALVDCNTQFGKEYILSSFPYEEDKVKALGILATVSMLIIVIIILLLLYFIFSTPVQHCFMQRPALLGGYEYNDVYSTLLVLLLLSLLLILLI